MANTSIAQFAGIPTSGNPWDPELDKTLIEYLDEKSDFRQFAKVVPVKSFVQIIPRKWSKGIAVEVVEGAEIPKKRNVYDHFTVTVHANGTGIRITDEEQELFLEESDLFQAEAKSAMDRLALKENQDAAKVLMAGAGISATFTSGKLDFEDILDFKTLMRKQMYGIDPTILLMSQDKYNDLVKDPIFRDYSQSGIGGVLETGEIGKKVAGMQIYIIKELEDSVYFLDQTKDPFRIAQYGQLRTEAYRLSETREDVLDIVNYSAPFIARPDAIGEMVIT